MKDTLQEIIGWAFPLIAVVLIVIAASRKSFPGKPWLIAYLGVHLLVMLAWRIPGLLVKFDSLDFQISRFYEVYSLPLNIFGLVGFCLLFPLIFAASSQSHDNFTTGIHAGNMRDGDSVVPDNTNHPLYGVHGWLAFFVVVNMYIAPIIFGIQQILGFVGFSMLANRYPGIVVVGVIEAAVGTALVIKWILIARRLRDIQPGVIQEAKKWMLITLAWNILSAPLLFASGMDAEMLIPGVVKQLFTGILSFGIWYSYFNVSKRVKVTYPDSHR